MNRFQWYIENWKDNYPLSWMGVHILVEIRPNFDHINKNDRRFLQKNYPIFY